VRFRPIFTSAALAAAALLLYGSRLGYPPASSRGDEASLAAQARSIAATGHDLGGRVLPLYVHIEDTLWFQPVPVYFTALILTLRPSGDSAVRVPSVIIGTLDIILIYLLGRRLFKNEWLALVAAGLLMLTPAHFIHSRIAVDALYPVPFVMAWLLCLVAYFERPRPWLLFAGTMFLGVGFYSHSSALLLMPAYLLLTGFALYADGNRNRRDYAAATIGFVLPLLCLVPWFLAHPATYLDTVGRWAIHPAYVRNPIDGLRAFFKWDTLSYRASLFWELLGPRFLFFGSVFLLPMAVLLAVGIHRFVTSRRSAITLVVLCGGVMAPLVASTFGERYAIGRELALLPFAVLVATCGVQACFSARNGLWRIVGVCLLLAIPLQFSSFYRSDFSPNRPETASIGSPR
jgi:4-amino-4-deoxy-L-arabinose transferase-like glycosyltransferase